MVQWLTMGPFVIVLFNPGPAEPGYSLPLQTVLIEKKPTDLGLHRLSIVIKYVNLYQQPGSSNLTG